MLQNAMFPVKEVPIMYDVVGKEKSVISGHKFIVREDTDKILSCMTDNYKLVKNETIIKYAEPIIKKNGGKIKEVNVLCDGAKVHMSWHFPKQVVNIGKNDDLTPEIVIRNSYDGTVGVNIIAGAFRLICSNGAIIGIVAKKYTNKHIKSNVSLDDLEGVIEETMNNTKVIFKEEFPILQGTNFKDRHLVDFLQLFPIQANEMVTQSLIANKPKSFWDLFNVGTNVLTHHMNRTTESTHSIENQLYPALKKWALKESVVAVA
tara:strand:- start:115 stop:900 length:786 start_codon:yes stop_codon:yes gene_type:complete